MAQINIYMYIYTYIYTHIYVCIYLNYKYKLLIKTPGVGDGQGGLVCCSPWGHKESDTTERLN